MLVSRRAGPRPPNPLTNTSARTPKPSWVSLVYGGERLSVQGPDNFIRDRNLFSVSLQAGISSRRYFDVLQCHLSYVQSNMVFVGPCNFAKGLLLAVSNHLHIAE